jgi:hypothetical protein
MKPPSDITIGLIPVMGTGLAMFCAGWITGYVIGLRKAWRDERKIHS